MIVFRKDSHNASDFVRSSTRPSFQLATLSGEKDSFMAALKREGYRINYEDSGQAVAFSTITWSLRSDSRGQGSRDFSRNHRRKTPPGSWLHPSVYWHCDCARRARGELSCARDESNVGYSAKLISCAVRERYAHASFEPESLGP